ncbi:hypothetical protein PSACC_03354 [Paramicrosporidium saccamoebae]|uniref:BRO domain-containing protein 1 n=1 Tax=Paramicrosporidium saccamoebae TaxID=1246581 RepID=A0A2H9TGD6_9FUNG|nr:hypothetical protein PSACC_03354 [Paramicrosporidium saccamoebae]
MVLTPTLPIPASFERIAVPCKITNEADWVHQLQLSLSQLGEDPATFQGESNQFHKMRQDLRGAPSTSGGLDIIVSYYRQLEALVKRIDIAEHPLTISFLWFDAFDRGNCVKQSSVAFEKANVLFNLGALFSQIESLNDTVRHLQLSASVFSFIADNFLHPPLVDIGRSSLIFLSSLMLAQAQEVATLKAIQDGKSPAILARLAAAASNFFHDAYTNFSSGELREFRDYFCDSKDEDTDPASQLSLKEAAWTAIKDFCLGLSAYNDSRIGEAICRFRIVNQMLVTHGSLGETDVGQYALKLRDLSESYSIDLDKENNLIYNQNVPSVENLAQPECAPLVKLVEISECFTRVPEKPDLFKRLMPIRIHEEISKYSEEKSKLLRYESLKVTNADNDLQTALSSLGFPTVLEKVTKLIKGESITDIASPRGAESKQVMKNEIDRLHTDLSMAVSMIEKTGELLDTEIREYQKMRVTHGEAWQQVPSHVGNSTFFLALSKLESLHAKLKNQLFEVDSSLQARTDSSDVPKTKSRAPRPELHSVLHRLCEKLSDLEGLSKKRGLALEELKRAILADDISDSIYKIKPEDMSTFFHQEMSKFDNCCQDIEDNAGLHKQTLSDFVSEWGDLVKDCGLAETEIIGEGMADLRQEAQEVCNRVTTFTNERLDERDKFKREAYSADCQEGQLYLIEKLSFRQNRRSNDRFDSEKITPSKPSASQVEYSSVAPGNSNDVSSRKAHSLSITIKTDVHRIAKCLQEESLIQFWTTISKSTDYNAGFPKFIHTLSALPINLFPGKALCKKFDRDTILKIMSMLSKTPWLLHDFFGRVSCVAKLAERASVEGYFIEFGYTQISLPSTDQRDPRKRRLNTTNQSEHIAKLARCNPTHPEVTAWLRKIPAAIVPDTLASADFDFASGLDVRMNLSHGSPLSQAVAKSIETSDISIYGLIHYLSIICQTKLSQLANVGTTMSRMVQKNRSQAQSKLLFFVSHIIHGSGADETVFSNSVQALWNEDPPWQRMARTFVDMVIAWTRKFKANPLSPASIGQIPVLYPEHLFVLFEGIGNAEITGKVARVIFASDEMALCRILKADRTKLPNFTIENLYKLRCARTQSLFLDTRKQDMDANNYQPTRTNYIVSRFIAMYKQKDDRVISRYQNMSLTVSVADLQNVLSAYKDCYTLIDLKKSFFGDLPQYRLNRSSDNFVIALVIDYSLRIYGQPSVLLGPDFCADVASENSRSSFKLQRGRNGRTGANAGRQSYSVIQAIREILSQGALKWIPQENWCTIISA